MTKYLVNSGGTKNSPDKGRQFFLDMVEGLAEPKILICLFAQPRGDWETKYAEDLEQFKEIFSDKKPDFQLACPDKFKEQLSWCDAIYLHGGDDHLIQYWLKQFDLPKAWEGKVVATSSASSHALAKHFWTCDWRKCMDGLGILPIKFLAHFKSHYGENDPRGPIDWDLAYRELTDYGDPSLKIYALAEGLYEVFEK